MIGIERFRDFKRYPGRQHSDIGKLGGALRVPARRTVNEQVCLLLGMLAY